MKLVEVASPEVVRRALARREFVGCEVVRLRSVGTVCACCARVLEVGLCARLRVGFRGAWVCSSCLGHCLTALVTVRTARGASVGGVLNANHSHVHSIACCGWDVAAVRQTVYEGMRLTPSVRVAEAAEDG